MHSKSKIIQIVCQLPGSDFKRFKLFLESPYFNKNKKLVQLLHVRKVNSFSPSEIHKAVFPGIPFNQQVFKNQLSQLMKLFKKFLAVELMNDDANFFDIMAGEKATIEGLQQMVGIKAKDFDPTEIAQESLLSVKMLDKLMYREFYNTFYKSIDVGTMHKVTEHELKFQEAARVLNQVEIFCRYLFIQQKYPTALQSALIEEQMKDFSVPEVLQDSFLIQMYAATLKLNLQPSESNYLKLKSWYDQHANEMHPNHIDFFAAHLGNYCIRKINRGVDEFNEELFRVYERQMLADTSYRLTDPFIQNFVKICCRIAKTDLVSEYLHENKYRISENAFNFSLAIIEHYQKNYKKSLEILNGCSFSTPSYQVNARHLVINNLLHQEDFDAALNQMESLRIFLLRAKGLNASRKKSNNNYLKFLKAFLQLKLKSPTIPKASYLHHLEQLATKIQHCKNIMSRIVLLRFIEEEQMKVQ